MIQIEFILFYRNSYFKISYIIELQFYPNIGKPIFIKFNLINWLLFLSFKLSKCRYRSIFASFLVDLFFSSFFFELSGFNRLINFILIYLRLFLLLGYSLAALTERLDYFENASDSSCINNSKYTSRLSEALLQ